MGRFYRYRRGDQVTITSGRYKGRSGIVESAVYQRTVDRPDGYDAGYHVVIGEGEVVTVRGTRYAIGLTAHFNLVLRTGDNRRLVIVFFDDTSGTSHLA